MAKRFTASTLCCEIIVSWSERLRISCACWLDGCSMMSAWWKIWLVNQVRLWDQRRNRRASRGSPGHQLLTVTRLFDYWQDYIKWLKLCYVGKRHVIIQMNTHNAKASITHPCTKIQLPHLVRLKFYTFRTVGPGRFFSLYVRTASIHPPCTIFALRRLIKFHAGLVFLNPARYSFNRASVAPSVHEIGTFTFDPTKSSGRYSCSNLPSFLRAYVAPYMHQNWNS